MSAGGRGSQQGIAYRPEIDGLRAIAVLVVILYHGAIPGFSGGFIGVDLFFAISGYLITGILVADLSAGQLSIAHFYERRVRRIIPALMLVMLLCIPPALWLMLPDDLENFGQSLVGTTFFANNFLLLATTGYFGIDVQFKPLMHTWSLGIEEQYYLLVPVMMWAAWRWGKARGVAIGIAAVTLLSFAACVYLQTRHPRADFFLILTRGWELGLGSLAMLLEPRLRPLAGKAAAAGLGLLGLAMALLPLLYPNFPPVPGLETAIPVLGLCLILVFGSATDPIGRMLSSKPLVGLGLVSYSAYLIHQPLFAFTRLASLEAPSPWLLAGLIVPVFLLAGLSWRFVEQPCRDRSRVSTRKLLWGWALSALVVVAAGMTFHLTSGFYKNWPQLSDGHSTGPNANIAYNLAPDRFRTVSLPATGEKVRVLVIGNSFGRDFINMALETGRVGDHLFAFRVLEDCRKLPPEIVAQARNADFIVLSTRFAGGQVNCIVKRVAELRDHSSGRVIVIGRKSFGYNNNAVMLLPASQRPDWRVTPLRDATRANNRAVKAIPADTYVDMLALLGDDRGKVRVFTPEGKFISQDRQHFTRPGAIYVGSIVFRHPALAALLDAKPRPAQTR